MSVNKCMENLDVLLFVLPHNEEKICKVSFDKSKENFPKVKRIPVHCDSCIKQGFILPYKINKTNYQELLTMIRYLLNYKIIPKYRGDGGGGEGESCLKLYMLGNNCGKKLNAICYSFQSISIFTLLSSYLRTRNNRKILCYSFLHIYKLVT